ncbi:titin [Trichonephila inaurata madagascariensis]|uniref:Titin n=1 Tax=Trichonephila inaurata madagascariensis TaxID=2747483 RepID=A0A8X7CFQ2_9ARAC|nr:titin [Trichonephila inaurata madagascariensis]
MEFQAIMQWWILASVIYTSSLAFQTGISKIQKFSFPDQVISGTKTSVICTAISGMPPMEFKWLKNGHPLKTTQKSTIRTYADFSVIFLEDVDQSTSGNYTCELKGPMGSDSYTAILEVKEAPQWIKQPKDTTLNSGDNVSLECIATGYPLPNVTWKKTNGGIQEHYETVQDQKQTKGKSLLEIKQASTTDSGNYVCIAENDISSIKTGVIIISVSDLPRVQKFSFPDLVITGQRTSAHCTAVSGTPPMNFKWLKDGQVIKPVQKYSIRSGADYSILFIEHVDLTTSGNYTCELTSSVGVDKYTTILEVKEPPKWVKEPKDLYISAGENISIECSATGYPLPNVTWMKLSGYKDGPEEVKDQQQIRGKSILFKKHTGIEDAGFYMCVADNGISKIQTNGIILSISASPKIQPFNLASHFRTGEKVTLFCAIKSGTPPFSFAWMKNSQPLSEDASVEIHQLKDFSSLVFTSLTLESRGNYTCKVSNAFGSDFYTEFLNVVVPPKWKSLPKDQEVVVGDHLSLKCEVEGYPTPVVLWKGLDKGQTENINKAVQQLNSRIKTEDAVFEINGITEEDEGDYICEASNGIGNGITHSVVISVLGNPRIQPFIFPEKLTEGQKTKVLCTVIEGSGPFKFFWYKNDHALTSSSSVTIQNGEEYSMLLFNSLSTEHGGNYSCVVTNAFGRDSYSSQFIINVPPSISQEPVDQTLQEGNAASFLCHASGFPQPTVTWMKEEGSKEIIEDERIKKFSNGTLIILNVKKTDEGIYGCTVSNNIGQDLHKLVSLTVFVPARFEEKFTMKNVRRGETATLKCEAVGDKPLSITWTKDKAEIDFKKHTR